jgi:hypothetical protein
MMVKSECASTTASSPKSAHLVGNQLFRGAHGSAIFTRGETRV